MKDLGKRQKIIKICNSLKNPQKRNSLFLKKDFMIFFILIYVFLLFKITLIV